MKVLIYLLVILVVGCGDPIPNGYYNSNNEEKKFK